MSSSHSKREAGLSQLGNPMPRMLELPEHVLDGMVVIVASAMEVSLLRLLK